MRFRVCLALVGVLLAPHVCSAQQPKDQPAGSRPPLTVPGDGTEVFRALLDRAKILPVNADELNRRLQRFQFDDVILIVLGNANFQINPAQSPVSLASNVIRKGGAVLIASDTPVTFTDPFGNRTIESSGWKVGCRNLQFLHRGEPTCPYVVPVPVDDTSSPSWRLFHSKDDQGRVERLNRLAANAPSFWTIRTIQDEFQNVLARFPANCWYSDRNEVTLDLPRNAAFAVSGEGQDDRSPYRFLAIADHSIFINQMLLEPGTDNLEFTYRVIEYLQGPTKRTKCIFYENGKLIDHFDDIRQAFAKQNSMPMPQIDMVALQQWLVTQGNRFIEGVQQDDVINRALNRGFGLPLIARFFLLVLAAVACFFLVRRIWTSRNPTDIPPAPAIAGAPSGPPGVFDRRQRELLRRNNVYEPVRDLVREFFASLGIHCEQGSKHPKLVISDQVRKPDSLRTAIKDLWKLAFGPPQILTINRWRELEPYFNRVRQAQVDGKWRFNLSEEATGSVA